MKNSYQHISFSQGLFNSGIYSVKVVPREWLLYPIMPDFNTGIIVNEVLLIPDKEFIKLEFTPDSYEYGEKPKSNKGGDYFEVSLQGNLNNLTPELLQILETLRNHELVVILKDKQKRMKVVGNQDAGMILRYSNKEDATKQGGLQIISVDLNMDLEKAAPFYEI